MNKLTHLDENGAAQMVDVSAKAESEKDISTNPIKTAGQLFNTVLTTPQFPDFMMQ